jgi:hypothetical protein
LRTARISTGLIAYSNPADHDANVAMDLVDHAKVTLRF